MDDPCVSTHVALRVRRFISQPRKITPSAKLDAPAPTVGPGTGAAAVVKIGAAAVAITSGGSVTAAVSTPFWQEPYVPRPTVVSSLGW